MVQNKLDIDILAERFLQKCKKLPPITVAVVYPCSQGSLKGAIESAIQSQLFSQSVH